MKAPVDRRGALRRALAIQSHLQRATGWVSLASLAEKFACSQRTIRRDLEALDDVGAVRLDWSADEERNYRAHVRVRRAA